MRWPATRPPAPLQPRVLAAALRAFLAALGFPRSGVTVLFASDAALRRLNARHRGQATPTDILSWSYLEPGRARKPEVLGELAVSLDRARAQARENGWPLQTEVLRLLAHGCAHLAGYDHATRAQDRAMRLLEERLLRRVGIRGLYPPQRSSQAKGGRKAAHPTPGARPGTGSPMARTSGGTRRIRPPRRRPAPATR